MNLPPVWIPEPQGIGRCCNRLKALGITVLVSTPYMDEAMQCDRVALMQHGTLLQVDTPDNIIASYNKPIYA